MRAHAFAALLVVIGTGGAGAGAAAAQPILPEPPRATVEVPASTPGRAVPVLRGADLQAALDDARPGDVLFLEAGATYQGPFTLPRKEGARWIVVRSDGALPRPGTRATPSHAAAMARLVSASGAVLRAAAGAHHFRFVGVEIAPAPGEFLDNLVLLGDDHTDTEDVPHHIVFDRCWLHGDPHKGARRGIAMNSAHTAVVDSWLSDFKAVGMDSQAVCGWAGPGPFLLRNDYLEGAGENVMFGGGNAPDKTRIPSDIEILGNHFRKPLSWKQGEPDFAGTEWTVKNLFELKDARRVRIEGNLFEQNWAQAQVGFAVLFTVRNQGGSAPWSVVEDVTFAGNVVRRAAGGINILGRDDSQGGGCLASNPGSERTRRLLVRDNLFSEVGDARWGGGGVLLQILKGVSDLTVERNTGLHTGSIIMAEGEPMARFTFRRNLVAHNKYGIVGTGSAPGNETLARYFPGAVIEGNVIAGADPARYPGGNFFPASLEEVGRLDETGRFVLAATAGALDPAFAAAGLAPGAPMDALTSAFAAALP